MNKRIVLVTGGTGGIGTQICRRLANDNSYVIAAYFKDGRHEEARKWQETQKSQGYDIALAYADVSNFNDCERLVKELMEHHGRIDVLVNNAGITKDSTLKKMSLSAWQQVIETNLNSVFHMTHHVLPVMLEHQYGRIINIASINGRKGQFGQCNYAAAKSALYGFTKSVALEVAKQGITVNTISPGYIETPMLSNMRQEILEKIVSDIPVGRLGKPEEIAEAVAFLTSPFSGFITGSNLDINGGQYM